MCPIPYKQTKGVLRRPNGGFAIFLVLARAEELIITYLFSPIPDGPLKQIVKNSLNINYHVWFGFSVRVRVRPLQDIIEGRVIGKPTSGRRRLYRYYNMI